MYEIKAIPTTYAGVNFRSRLEARWGAFLDLAGLKWEYEPFDLEGWAPDFLIRTSVGPVLAEVKPYDVVDFMKWQVLAGGQCVTIPEYEKAFAHARQHQVLLLGSSPVFHDIPFPFGLPVSVPRDASHTYDEIIDALYVDDMERVWREAGNVVQWDATSHNKRRRKSA